MEQLARQALLIEQHYGRPMDIEWAKDGHTGKLYIVQARPETVRSNEQVMERYHLASRGKVLIEGRALVSGLVPGRSKSSTASAKWIRYNRAMCWLPI